MMKAVLQNVSLVVVAVIGAVLIFEFFTWVLPWSFFPRPLREVVERMDLYRHHGEMYVPDPELLFKIRPHTDFILSHPDFSARVKTNLNLDGIGFRGGSLGGPAWAVAVGDSFTFGLGVEQEETWVYHLAKAMGQEVINLAVPNQGPPQYTRILKRYGLPLGPRVVFYGFFFNDLHDSDGFYGAKQRDRSSAIGDYLRYYSVTYNLFRVRGGRALFSPDIAIDIKVGGVEFYFNLDQMRRTLKRQNHKFDERWKLTAQELSEAIKASKEADVTLVVVYLPSRWEVYWDVFSKYLESPETMDLGRARRTLLTHCDEQKILCLDLTESLKHKANQGEKLYFRIDGHWNKEGNRVVAEEIQRYLLAKKIVE
jgi:SGNH hydrolase-like domain, acetyltransferase AlgX